MALKDGDIIIDQPGAFARFVEETRFGIIPTASLKNNKPMFLSHPVRVPSPRPFDVTEEPECDPDDPTIPKG